MSDRDYFDKFFDDVGDTGTFEAVLRGHLWVEHELLRSLEAALPVPALADLDRLRFGDLVRMVAAHGLMQADEVGGFQALNSLRNKLAHNVDATLTEQHETDLVNALGTRHRDHIEALKAREMPQEFPYRLKYAVTAMCISLQIDREALRTAHRRMREASERLLASAEQRGIKGHGEPNDLTHPS